jgi:hypothetical protein
MAVKKFTLDIVYLRIKQLFTCDALRTSTVSMAASGSAFRAFLWIFKRVRNMAEVRKISSERRWAEILAWQ